MYRRRACPVSLYVSGRTVVVAGDGPGPERRAERMRAAGAAVVQIARDAYRPEALAGAFAVLANDEDGSFNARVATDARARGALAYAHDLPDLSDFAMPAIAEHGPIQLAISTDGLAPALARRLRQELERVLEASGPALDALLHQLERRRAEPETGRRGALGRIASRLRLDGRVVVDEDDRRESDETT